MTSCHELIFICIPLFCHAYIMRIPSFAMSFSYQIGASPDCHRFICHLHFCHLSPRLSNSHLYVSLSNSVSHCVRLCQTVQTEYIRFPSPFASLLLTSSLVSASRVPPSVGRRPCARRLLSTSSSSAPYGPSPNSGRST